jgi:lipopolysaccharide transport system ATP-binding protein
MGADTVIRVDNLGKKYLLRHDAPRYFALRDVIVESAKRYGNRLLHPLNAMRPDGSKEEFWALRDVSFEVKRGDRLGIIGRNGAGKSTLLKILGRITEPTRGRVSIKGRVSSLLEVGTGFHPELTGRENIFLSGAVLGMSRADILARFDEIVAFAEVERFLDTPVKHYSSGMYIRLAFAVAAHVQTRTLLIDEVLAVGDVQFQKKCLGKMENVSREGRTVLFVSHNMNAIEQLCNSALLLKDGHIQEHGFDVNKIIRDYVYDPDRDPSSSAWRNQTGEEYQNAWFTPHRFCVTDRAGNLLQMPVRNDQDIWIELEAFVQEVDPALTVGYAIYSEEGYLLYWSYQTDQPEERWPKITKGRCVLRGRIPRRLLNQGTYRVELIGGLHFRKWLFEPGKNCPSIYLSLQGGLSDSPYWMAKRPGLIAPETEWVEAS